MFKRKNFSSAAKIPGIFLILMIAAVFAIVLGGCSKKNSRGDIKSYVKKTIGLKNPTVSQQYEEIQEDEEGYLDHLWTVTDDDSGITFHVLDDYYWALEKVENQLLDDYDSSVFLALLDEGKIPQDNDLSLKTEGSSGLARAELSASFTDLNGLEKCYEDLCSIRDALEQAGYEGLKIPYTVKYNNPIRGVVDYEIDEGDTVGEVGSLGEEELALMRQNYLTCALDYRFEDALKEFSQEEIDALVNSPGTVRLYKAAAAGSGAPSGDDFYRGVIGSPKYSGISFGTLYELLRLEGFEPEGDSWHFAFYAPDGRRLEFSYDFNDLSGFNDAEGKLQKGYYYIDDDKKMRMSAYYVNHFEPSEIEKLTGIKVEEDRSGMTQQGEEDDS